MRVRVAWLINHRPKDIEGDHVENLQEQLASLARLEQAPLCMELSPFSAQDAAELAASMLELPASAPEITRLVEALGRQRELTPLYVEQSLWTLFASGSLAVVEPGQRWQGQWQLDAESIAQSVVPSSVREAIGNRASRLSAETLRLLGIAAVTGKAFDVEVVARAANIEAEQVLAALDQAGAAGFVAQEQGPGRHYLADSVTSDIGYRFCHDRYRESILSNLESSMKRTTHGQLARAILTKWGEVPATYPLLAEHYFAGQPGPGQKCFGGPCTSSKAPGSGRRKHGCGRALRGGECTAADVGG
jgi:predicted ATPase